jgi:sugar phosphate isomerase/epimerase
MNGRVSISQITTVTQSFADDLDAYRAAGADGIGIWEMKLENDSLDRFRQSGLEAATAVPAVPSILPLPLMEGPAEPAARVEAICAGIKHLAPFEPPCVLFLTGPGDDREAILDGLGAIGDEGARSGVRVALEPVQREFADFWTVVSSLDEAAALISESGADIGLIYDTWHLWREPVEQVERHRDRIYGVHLADWREPTRNTNDRVLPGEGVIEFGPILEALRWNGLFDLEIFSDAELPTLSGRKNPAGSPLAASSGSGRSCRARLHSRSRRHRQPLRGSSRLGERDHGPLPARGTRCRAERTWSPCHGPSRSSCGGSRGDEPGSAARARARNRRREDD